MNINEKLNLIADLEAENLSTEMIENVVYMDEHPEAWVGPFTLQEAMEYLESEDEEVLNENN